MLCSVYSCLISGDFSQTYRKGFSFSIDPIRLYTFQLVSIASVKVADEYPRHTTPQPFGKYATQHIAGLGLWAWSKKTPVLQKAVYVQNLLL